MFTQLKYKKLKCIVGIAIFLFSFSSATCQNLTVYTVQNVNFGTFYPGNNGGTVSISPDGTRSVTGDVILLNVGSAACQGIFEIEARQGSIVSILNGPDVLLTGSNGGTMSLHIGNSLPGASFVSTVAPPGRTSVSLGATLTVASSAATVPGAYSGNFFVTFNNE